MSVIKLGTVVDYWKSLRDWVSGENKELVPAVRSISFTEVESKRKVLVANSVSTFSFSKKYDKFDIVNLSDSEAVFIKVNNTNPEIEGEDSIVIPAGTCFTINVTLNEIRAISSSGPTLQIVGYK